MLDLVPKCLEVGAEMNFLPEFQFPSIARIDDAVLEDLAVDLVGDFRPEISERI